MDFLGLRILTLVGSVLFSEQQERGKSPLIKHCVASKCSDSIGLHVHAYSSLDTWVLVILQHGLDVLYFVWVFKAIETKRIQLITYGVHSEML